MPVPTPISPTVGPAEGVSVFGGQGVGLQRSGCRFGAAYAGKLKATMTDEQKELFEKYIDCVREYQTTTDCLIFQNSFKLGARMMLEVMADK